MKCGSLAIAQQVLKLPLEQTISLLQPPSWLQCCLEGPRQSVWLGFSKIELVPSTDPSPSVSDPLMANKSVEGQLSNRLESKTVRAIVAALLVGGTSSTRVGIISPFQAQVRRIRQELSDPVFSGVEIHTVDKYQGRDKDVILLSLVRTDGTSCSRRTGETEAEVSKVGDEEPGVTGPGSIGELLRDIRRINVALTRAKSKLIIIGDSVLFSAHVYWKDVIRLISDRNNMIQVCSTDVEIESFAQRCTAHIRNAVAEREALLEGLESIDMDW
jgi:DNA replication ATP-dependent helicase Dna2